MRPKAYRGFANQSTGKAFRYLALLVLLVTIPAFIYIYHSMSPGTEKLAGQIKKSWPDFKLTRGTLEVNAPMPLIIDNGDGSLTIIDTSGRGYPAILQVFPAANYIITRDQIFQRRGAQARVVDLKSLRFVTFSKETLIYFMDHFEWFAVLTIIGAFPLLYLFKILEAALAALLAMLSGLLFGNSLDYNQYFRISIYALTVPFIAQGLQKAVWPDCPYPGILFYALLLTYLVIGVRGATKSRIVL